MAKIAKIEDEALDLDLDLLSRINKTLAQARSLE